MTAAPPADPLPLHPLQYEPLVRASLIEDLGRAGDLTTNAIVPPDAQACGYLMARSGGCVAGLHVAATAFQLMDPAARYRFSPTGRRHRRGRPDTGGRPRLGQRPAERRTHWP